MPKGIQGFQRGHGNFSGAEKGWFKPGQTPHNKGKPGKRFNLSEEAKEKIRQSKLILYKDKTKHPSYKDGRTFQKNYQSFMSRKRQIKISGNGGSHTIAEWETLKAQYNWTCPCCGEQEPFESQWTKNLVKDHIIPLAKGGTDNIENIQPLCFSCNAKKHIKVVIYERPNKDKNP